MQKGMQKVRICDLLQVLAEGKAKAAGVVRGRV